MTHWSGISEKGAGYWRLRLLLFVYRCFGRFVLQIFIFPVVFSVFLFSAPTRNFSLQYLERVCKQKLLKEGACELKPDLWTAFRHFYSFADSLADKVASWEGKINVHCLSMEHPEVFSEITDNLKNNKGVFFICSHLGNIELFRAVGKLQAGEVHKMRIHAITQIAHSPFFEQFLKELHPEVETNLLSALDIGVDTVIYLKERLEEGDIVVTAGDRTAAVNETKSFAIDFLGQKAYFPLGSFNLATLLDGPVYFVFLLKTGVNKYSLYTYKPQSLTLPVKGSKQRQVVIESLITEYASRLEALCLRYPLQWFNFFDFWKIPSS